MGLSSPKEVFCFLPKKVRAFGSLTAAGRAAEVHAGAAIHAADLGLHAEEGRGGNAKTAVRNGASATGSMSLLIF